MNTKGFASSVLILLFLMTVSEAAGMDIGNVTISGEINAIAKIQDPYMTPLDASSDRAGANYRDDQNFRGFGNVVFSYGMPGLTEWFAAAKIKFDANDPDIRDNDHFTDGYKNDNNYSDYNFQMEYAFVMYRPFQVAGGRPFGIMAGMIPIKATANAAYFHFFKADPEEDFILYTCSALTEVPGIGIDFHLSENTGIGLAFARGVKDASEIGLLMMPDSAENWILWAEIDEFNIGFNIAYQYVKGEGEPSDRWTTPAGNILYKYNQPFKHSILNTMLTYRFGMGGFNLMPTIGYQQIKGDECMVMPGYAPRDIDHATLSYGLKIGMNLFNAPGEFALLYTDVLDRKKIEGIKSIPKGTIATALASLGISGTPDFPEEGKGKGVLALLEVSSILHAEYTLRVNPSTEVGLFGYHMKSVDDPTKYEPYIHDQINATLADTPLSGLTAAISKDVAAQLKSLEWTDSTSYGLFVRVSF